ncbi:uncharacterized protein LOC116844124 [Odontomachus brunneus]|uniref:uncharacterized protein LOC116844124 n=1 Tax=Odontomachus brunneus TaxID=486640 RepID=UPI0013F26877|nr:uncharacterized protein LOC116844124 [Odontomachus brunneus]
MFHFPGPTLPNTNNPPRLILLNTNNFPRLMLLNDYNLPRPMLPNNDNFPRQMVPNIHNVPKPMLPNIHNVPRPMIPNIHNIPRLTSPDTHNIPGPVLSKSDEFPRPVLSKNYDFFNPNICHVCKMPWSFGEDFQTCYQCHMISYCSETHRITNKKCHMQICIAFQKILWSYPHLWSTCGINLEQWVQTRKDLMHLVKLELQRDLKPYEVQMITLAKSCIICYRQIKLTGYCRECNSCNYCSEHQNLFRHFFNCDKLKLCLWTNTDISLYPIVMDRFTEFPNNDQPVDNMDAFVDEFVYSKYEVDETSSV